jgi:hypothetical protein
MTTLTRSEDIAELIAARMGTIQTTNGAETDAGRIVYRGRRKIEDTQVPCSVLVEGEDQPGEQSGRLMNCRIDQRYVLVAYDVCDPDNPNTKAHALLRDLKRAVFTSGGQPDMNFDKRVLKVVYRGRDIGPRADGGNIVMAVIEIDVEYVESLATP